MAKVITVTNVKGGVGKSVSSLFMAKVLSESHKVLLIDMDSQNSLTSYFIEDYETIKDTTIFDVLLDTKPIQDIVHTITPTLDFIPSDITLCNLSIMLTENRDYKLYTTLADIDFNYDYIYPYYFWYLSN